MFFFLECSKGFYGPNCLGNCSLNCVQSRECDIFTGHCNGGCQRGWTGAMCEEGKRQRNNRHGHAFTFFKEYTHSFLCK